MSKAALVARAAGGVLLACALAVAAWPRVAALQGALAAEAQFSEAAAACGQVDPQAAAAALDGARDANARAARGAARDEAAAALDVDGTGAVCWLEVPKVALKAPVFPEATDAALMAGAALAGTSSLPVGGVPSNTVVVGHTGMVGLEMFDRLDELGPGDEVLLWTLGERLRYEVRNSQVVEVERAEAMVGVEEGADLVTLVTCRPYGVNSHRLVVRAERAEGGSGAGPDEGTGGGDAGAGAGWASPAGRLAVGAAVAAGIAAAALAAAATIRRRRRKGKDAEHGR